MNDTLKSILSSTRYATVSTVDDGGKPWAAPVWYVVDEQMNLYWWSAATTQHSRNIVHSPNVYITIFDSARPEGEGLGLYAQATASEVSEAELDNVIELYNSSTQHFKMSRKNCSGEAPTRLYKAVPSNIWVNDGLEREGFYVDIRKKAEEA